MPVLPAPVQEEACYGWCLAVRKAEQKKREDLIGEALVRLEELVRFSRGVNVLAYDLLAQDTFRMVSSGRGNRSRSDLRIAAICIAHQVPLLTRNLADFSDLPDLRVLTW